MVNDLANLSYDDLLSAVDPELIRFPASSDMLMGSDSQSTNKAREGGESARVSHFSGESQVDNRKVVDTIYETRSIDFLDLIIDEIERFDCNSVNLLLTKIGCGCEALNEEEFIFLLEPTEEISLEEAKVEVDSGFLPVSSDDIAQYAPERHIEYLQRSERSDEDVAYSYSWDHSFIYDNPLALEIGFKPSTTNREDNGGAYLSPIASNDSSVSTDSLANTSTMSEEVEYCDATFLYLALEQRQWEVVTQRLRNHPDEAAVWIYQEENVDRSGWKILPLHAACIFCASSHVVKALIDAFPQAVEEPDLGGRLPLHLALYTCISAEVVRDLLTASPSTINAKDRMGMLPVALAESSTGVARSEILQILDFGIQNNGLLTDQENIQYANSHSRSEETKYLKKYRRIGLRRRRKKIPPLIHHLFGILKKRGRSKAGRVLKN